MLYIHDEKIHDEIINAWLNGWNDDSAGNVDYSYGHHIYHVIKGNSYAVYTDSLGNTQLISFETVEEMNEHKEMIIGLEDTTDEMELY